MLCYLAAKIIHNFKLRCGNAIFFPLSAPKFDVFVEKYATQVRK